MRNFKQTITDIIYLTSLSRDIQKDKSKNNILINNKNIKNMSDLEINSIPNTKYFISINPMKELGKNQLKDFLHLAYSRYLRFKLGKKYRDKEAPIKFDFLIEEKDKRISFNHIHIITKTPMMLNDFILFIGVLYSYLKEHIKTVNILSENINDELGAFNYIYKTKIIKKEDDKGKSFKQAIRKELILMNEEYL